jgi:hypothetical protein
MPGTGGNSFLPCGAGTSRRRNPTHSKKDNVMNNRGYSRNSEENYGASRNRSGGDYGRSQEQLTGRDFDDFDDNYGNRFGNRDRDEDAGYSAAGGYGTQGRFNDGRGRSSEGYNDDYNRNQSYGGGRSGGSQYGDSQYGGASSGNYESQYGQGGYGGQNYGGNYSGQGSSGGRNYSRRDRY